MHNWHVLYLPTCDGSSFLSNRHVPLRHGEDSAAGSSSSSSSSSSQHLHMRGRSILNATILHALEMGMSDAEAIVRIAP